MPRQHTPRALMTEEERLEARRRAKHVEYLRKTGRSVLILPEEADKLMAHVQDLAASGMSGAHISRKSGVPSTTVRRMVRGEQFRTLRRHYEALMRVEPAMLYDFDRRYGRDMPTWPIARRIQGLVADGFPMNFLAAEIGVDPHNSQWYRIVNGAAPRTTPNYLALSYKLYDKFAGSKPEDHGVSPTSAKRARKHAAKRGWAPTHCWDFDTIDSYLAIPEWTGACGTMRGYNMHYRERILPACRPCAEAKNAYDRKRAK